MFVITEDTIKFSIYYIFRFVSAQYYYGICSKLFTMDCFESFHQNNKF